MRPDPIPWIERLLDVNASSDFAPEHKIMVASALRQLLQKLGADVATTR